MAAWRWGWFGAAATVLLVLLGARFAVAQDGTPAVAPSTDAVLATPAGSPVSGGDTNGNVSTGGIVTGNLVDEATSGFIGSWRVDPTISGQVNPALTTFTNYGSVFTSNRPIQPGPPELTDGPIAQSLGHGTWEATGERTANIAFEFIQTDLTGTFLGFRLIRGTLELNEAGNEWTGRFTFETTDAAGTTVLSGEGTVVAQRIEVEPAVFGTPAA